MEQTDAATGIIYREGTFDSWILNESRSYFPIGLMDGDRVLDLGGHIGAFACRAKMEKNVPLLSIEPEHSNFNVLHKNSFKFGFGTFCGAIVEDDLDQEPIELYVNALKNNALHSIVPVRGRRTQSTVGFGFSRTVNNFIPTIIKCDIEGGEYNLPWSSLKENLSVRKIIMELHLTHKGHRLEANQLCILFDEMGFQCTKTPKIGEKNWTTMAIWERIIYGNANSNSKNSCVQLEEVIV